MKLKSLICLFASMAVTAGFTSCSDDEDGNPRYSVSFENSGVLAGGPTSYGENLYSNYSGEKFVSGAITVDASTSSKFEFGINTLNGTTEFYNGGIVLSRWAIRSNPAGKTAADWWYSYMNQLSVYDVDIADGASSSTATAPYTFGVIFGYVDGASSAYKDYARFNFSNGGEYVVKDMAVCNTSYVYGVLVNGNPYGISGPDVSIMDAKGWFKALAYGFDAKGNPTNGGKPVEYVICDYSTTPAVELADTWRTWDLSALGEVNEVRFNFEGSDTGAWGLNTPAYLCFKNIRLEKILK